VSGARAVTQYTVPVGLVSRLGVIPMSLARTLFPRFSGQPAAEAREVGGRAVAALVIVLTPLTALGAVVLEPFLRLWVGDSLAQTAAPIGEIALLGAWVNGLAFVPQTLLEGQGRPDLPAKLHLVELPPYVLGLWVGLSAGGLEGAAWVWTARAAVNAVLLFAAARLYPRWSELAASACAVSLACAGALTLFDDPVWRISLGTALVLLSLAAVWRSVPTELRALRRS
jgi:O-antigen/teichoic acid export membrane protein